MKIRYALYASSIFLATGLAASAVVAADQNQTQQGMDRTGTGGYQSGAQGGSMGSGMARTDTSSRSGSIEVDDIKGKNIVNQSDDEIGEVEEIVRDQQSQNLHAVVSVGGFLGMGEKEVAIPLKDIQMRNDQLRAPQFANTKDQLEALPEYDESKFKEVDDDQRINYSDFAAFESDDSTSGMRSPHEGSGNY